MFGGELIFRRVGLCLLELKLQLVEQPRRALGARSVNRARQLFDLRLRCAISARPCASSATAATAHAFSAAASVRAAISAAFNASMSSGSEERSASTNHMESQNRPFEAPLFAFLQPIFLLSDRRRTPCLLRHAPIDARQQIGKLGRRDRHRSVSQRWPQESPALQIALRTGISPGRRSKDT